MIEYALVEFAGNIHRQLSASLLTARNQLEDFECGLRLSSEGLLRDGAGRRMHPEEVVSHALDAQGGILCAPLHYLGLADPQVEDLPFLSAIVQKISAVRELALRVVRRLGLPSRFLRRFGFRYNELFTLGYFDRHGPRSACGACRYRQRVVAAVCWAVRRFLEWLRNAYRRLGDAIEGGHVIVIAQARCGLVDVCDRRRGLVVLKNPSGVGSRAFEISPGRDKVWEILRLLVGAGGPVGEVALPANYAAQFRNTTSQNEGCRDDLARLLRHIRPSPLHAGRYYLAWEPKPELRRGL